MFLLFSQMSLPFQEPWDIVPSYEISRQNTATELQIIFTVVSVFTKETLSVT